ncbi:dimethyladenosine transferase [Nesterenkonia salmonea]|uniref:Dimethyladenosine transferase n=1 Tax=Nesterenkonia salmonea TaxID=1804987 RepID=A0A5R9BCK8_9MICC|nr:SRPBCC family protein [Nesterenkonia salmonea]TLP96974.1 dimethyladenosine transferase [Nesterenkonia salmonea]
MEPVRNQAGPHVVSYSITVAAPADRLYAIVANPHRHHEIDGSETVQSRARGPQELTAGSRFSVHMRKFGIPYRLPLRVIQAQRPTSSSSGVVEWRQPTGHRWRWEFQPQDDATTLVTESYDASGQWGVVRSGLRCAKVPEANAHSVQSSLRRMAGVFTDTSP